MPGKEESIEKPSKSYSMLFLLLAVPVMLLGALSAAQVTGVIDLNLYLRQAPVVGRMIPQGGPAKQGFQQTLEEQQIAKLKAEKTELDAKLAEVQAKVAALPPQEEVWKKQKAELEKQIAGLKEQIKKLDQAKVDHQKMVERLSVMKPVNAAKILENLPDDMVNMLLAEMDIDTSAKIMAVFDPVRAARLAYPPVKQEQEARSQAEAAKKQSELTKTNFQGLAKTFAAMKAEDAISVIDQLPDNIAVSILKEMNQDAAGKLLSVLAAQNPVRAGNLVSLIGKSN